MWQSNPGFLAAMSAEVDRFVSHPSQTTSFDESPCGVGRPGSRSQLVDTRQARDDREGLQRHLAAASLLERNKQRLAKAGKG